MFNRLLKHSLIRFLIVGGIGFVINLAIFYLLVEILFWDPNVSAIITFIICTISNYVLNQIWSFREFTDESPNMVGLGRFFIIALIALGLNLLVLNIFLIFINPNLKLVAQFFGVLSGTFLNYIGAKNFVFRKDQDLTSN